MNVTARIAEAVGLLQGVKREIENRWPHYGDRPAEAKECEVSLEMALVDLEKCLREEAPALDRLVAREFKAVRT